MIAEHYSIIPCCDTGSRSKRNKAWTPAYAGEERGAK
jgi:hypothetical protein